jgi:hypothetical protein
MVAISKAFGPVEQGFLAARDLKHDSMHDTPGDRDDITFTRTVDAPLAKPGFVIREDRRANDNRIRYAMPKSQRPHV